MIEVILHGRLGNWLFEYAVGRALAHQLGVPLRLNLTSRRKLFDWRAGWVQTQLERFALEAELSTGRPGRKVYREVGLGWNEAVAGLPDGTTLDGFFQSERYFRDIAALIRKELEISPPNDAATAEVEARMQQTTAVSVHVRRTDYVRLGRNLLPPAWYEAAMDRLRTPRTRFFVFSDDPAWCRTQFRADDTEVVDLPLSRKDPVNDLRLMTLCRHHVIANSTYSWWGAWLAAAPDKTVLAPSVWLPDPVADAQVRGSILPPEWTVLAPPPT